MKQYLDLYTRADNSGAGNAAKLHAHAEITKYIARLAAFISKNPGTRAARECQKTIDSLRARIGDIVQ